MTLQQLIYFKEVAETLHFTKAAQNLYVTQSALSYAIGALERELAVPLFVRESGKRVELTSFGVTLLPMADRALGCIDEIEDTIQKMRNPMSGIVNIAYSYMNGWKFIPGMLGSFTRDNSSREISLSFEINHHAAHFEEDVVLGNIDLAFSCMSELDGLTTVPIVQQRLYVMLPCNHPLSDRESIRIDDILDETLVGHHQGRNLDRWINELYRVRGHKPNTLLYPDDWTVQVSLVALSKGIAILPELPIERNAVKIIPLDDPMSTRSVYMMWAKNRKLPPAVACVRDYCLEYCKNLPLI